MPLPSPKTAHVTFCAATDSGGLLSVNPGCPAEHALSEAVHLLDTLVDDLALACAEGQSRAYQMLTIADLVRALVTSCAEGLE
ncbi:hypothetical protein [Ectopseudomonas oleovorans]|uniref:DUF3077 domain-containing protein n=1 Tax=Ectopseudomonas oleovorans TaxID=301 RepID=A0A427H8H7_ECTOL|nr:hypothetical protein [Pseudomonas oleovorans]RRW29100.1 hypothetical protein EGJ44_20760 [Pseudomonas oleovorans]